MTRSVLDTDLEEFVGSCSPTEAAGLAKLRKQYAPHFDEISHLLYLSLTQRDRERFLTWFVKRWGAIDRVTPEEAAHYASEVERIRAYPYTTATLNGCNYKKMSVEPQGYKGIMLTYPWMLGIHDFLFDQYQHEDFRIHAGDNIIDAGAFVGDTALLFSQVAKGKCKIHAFEVLPENLQLLAYNLAANDIANLVQTSALALSDRSGQTVNIKTAPLQGATSVFGEDDGIRIETISIDDYVSRNEIERIDLIKMDIEGSEQLALAGALRTIQRDRPRLAICLYHRWDDIIEIPRIIASSGIPYRLSFKWVELKNGWEAVLFAQIDDHPQT